MILSDQCFLTDRCLKFKQGRCQKNSFCIKLFKENEIYNLALLSNSQRKHLNLRIDNDGTDREQFTVLKSIEDNIVNFVSNGENLYIYSSNCGNGKTSWALRLLQSYVDNVWYKCNIECKCLFVSVPKFFISLKDNITNKNDYIEHIKENIVDCDLVIWDDIGTKVGTEFEIENMLNIVDNRLCYSKSNIYTSNMDPISLSERIGKRLYSRIVNQSKNIQLNGIDKRGL